ncbi:hypothetical protein DM56_3652 [Burkholderia mallei]|nr:hypothetical protein DM46_1087 [Burkholderia mallei]KOS95340.1 hypothetical protein DM49_1962 [Burkholderia mallei]KOT10630.1 hypothetical protein DM56_3652 [Burkholderia mallei]
MAANSAAEMFAACAVVSVTEPASTGRPGHMVGR